MKFWQAILRYWDTALVILLAIVMEVFGVKGGNQSVLFSGMAGILSLLAYGMIQDRHERGELRREIRQITMPGVGLIFKSKSIFDSYDEKTPHAKLICLVGPSLIDVLSHWESLMQSQTKDEGIEIQAIVLDPDPECLATEFTARCMKRTPGSLRSDIDSAFSHVDSIRNEAKVGIQHGRIDLKLSTIGLNCSMLLVNPDEQNGKIFVEFTGYQPKFDKYPHIELTRQRDYEWYEYFLDQYKAIWRDSRERVPTSSRQKKAVADELRTGL